MSFCPRYAGHEGATERDMRDMADMGGASSSSSSTGSMAMPMVFHADTATPLFASSWTPHSGGAYAATCIFLVALAMVARLLVALRARQEQRWSDRDAQRRYVVVNGREPLAERISRDPDAKHMTMALSERGVEETVMVVARRHVPRRPWRFSVDPARAALDTAAVGIGYLLMLAVMTMNVGYFMSVLAGTFAGSMCLGRHSPPPSR